MAGHCPVARNTGARLITYDRAGFGQSDPNPAPYDITQEVGGLERGLKQLQVNGDLILVAHSYGGFLATLFAARKPPLASHYEHGSVPGIRAHRPGTLWVRGCPRRYPPGGAAFSTASDSGSSPGFEIRRGSMAQHLAHFIDQGCGQERLGQKGQAAI